MKLKQFTKYNIAQMLKNLAWFYAIYLAIFVILGGITFTFGGQSGDTFGGSISSGIFMFVVGIVLFSQNLRLGLANGVSRKTLSLGTALSVLALSLISAVLNLGFSELWALISKSNYSMSQVAFAPYFATHGTFTAILADIALGFATNLVWFSAGYFIGGAYYRMNRLARVLVSVLVPAGLIVGLPILATSLPKALIMAISGVVEGIYRFIFSSPFNYALLLACAAAVFGLFAWLLVRRAPLKTPQG